jgi:hypothetical protein
LTRRTAEPVSGGSASGGRNEGEGEMKNGYFPKQHGAWAMLVLPFLFGMFAAGPKPIHGLLFLGWLCAYLFSYPLLQWLRTGKKRVYQTPTFLYGGVLFVIGAALLIWKPELFRWAPLFIPMLLVNLIYARRNRERAVLNDLAAVVQFSLMVFVAFDAGGGEDWRFAAGLFLLSLLYFTGTVFYVKTMIREKNNKRFYRLSVAYHAVLPIVVGLTVDPLLVPVFVVLFIRAVWTPRTNLSVKAFGMLEFAYAALMIVSVAVVTS